MKKRFWVICIASVCLLIVGYVYFSNQNQEGLMRVDALPGSSQSLVMENSPTATDLGSEGYVASTPEATGQPYVASTLETTGEPEPSDNTDVTPSSIPVTAAPPIGNPDETQPAIDNPHSSWTLEDARPLSTPEILGNIKNKGYATIDGEILYMNEESSEINKGRIVSINLATGEKKVIVESSGAYLMVRDEFLYYIDITEGHAINVGPLYRIELTTGVKEKLTNERVCVRGEINSGIVYVNDPNDHILFNTETLEKSMFDIQDNVLGFINPKCYYRDLSRKTIYVYDMQTKESKELFSYSSSIIDFLLHEDYIYYVVEGNKKHTIERFNLTTNTSTIIYEGDVYQINFYKDNLIFTTRSVTQNENLARYERDAYIIDLSNNSVTKLSNKFGDMGAIIGDKMVSFSIPMEDSYSQIIVTDIK